MNKLSFHLDFPLNLPRSSSSHPFYQRDTNCRLDYEQPKVVPPSTRRQEGVGEEKKTETCDGYTRKYEVMSCHVMSSNEVCPEFCAECFDLNETLMILHGYGKQGWES